MEPEEKAYMHALRLGVELFALAMLGLLVGRALGAEREGFFLGCFFGILLSLVYYFLAKGTYREKS